MVMSGRTVNLITVFPEQETCLGKSCSLRLSSVILLFVNICLSVFPFDVWDGLWVLIRPVREASLLL